MKIELSAKQVDALILAVESRSDSINRLTFLAGMPLSRAWEREIERCHKETEFLADLIARLKAHRTRKGKTT